MIQYQLLMQKRIGTLVPISALFSLRDTERDKGTFASGLVFLDWLQKTHQSAWQLLPLYQTQLEPGSATKHIPSPYKGYGIGLDPKYLPSHFANLHPTEAEKKNFILNNSDWIHDYALFCALSDYFQTDDWRNWDTDIRNRETKTIVNWTNKLHAEIDTHIVIQWQLHMAYAQLKQKAKKLGIMLIGDLSFYVSLQSPLVWAHQDVFQIEKNGSIRYVSGVPNTKTSHFGRQVWGHPLYNWEHKEKVIAFWHIRLRHQTTLFDTIRFDHAKAIFAYGVMDTKNEQDDRYEKGPGSDVFEELIAFSLKNGLSIFAEDSGDSIKELRLVLNKLQIPGIKIFRFGLRGRQNKLDSKYADISQYPENTVSYTTTHDTETLLGYLQNLTPQQKQQLASAAHVTYDPEDATLAKKLRDAMLKSPTKMVIIPIQDWLLTTDRINVPGTELPVNDPNWQFKLTIPIEHFPTRLLNP